MALGSVFKNIVSGAKKLGAAVGNPMVQPEAAVPDATVADMGFDVPDFKLPELDPNDKDFEAKKAIHDAYEELGQMHAAHARTAGEGYKKQYNELAEGVRNRVTGKEHSPLSMFMIGMGSQEGMDTAAKQNQAVAAQRSKRDLDLLELKSQALRGQIAQHMEAGKFAQALKSSALLAEVQAVIDRVGSERDQAEKLAQLTVTEEGKNTRHLRTQERLEQISRDRMRVAMSITSGVKLPEATKLRMKNELDAALHKRDSYLKINNVTGLAFSDAEIAAAQAEYLKETDRIADWVNGLIPGTENDIKFSASSSMPEIPAGERVVSVAGKPSADAKRTAAQIAAARAAGDNTDGDPENVPATGAAAQDLAGNRAPDALLDAIAVEGTEVAALRPDPNEIVRARLPNGKVASGPRGTLPKGAVIITQ